MYICCFSCGCFATCAEEELKIFVPIWCKHSKSTIVAIGGIRVKMFLNLEILTKFYVLYHNSAKTGCIPEPAAADDLVGSSSAFCACIHMVCLHKCLEISPTANQDYIYINFEIWK